MTGSGPVVLRSKALCCAVRSTAGVAACRCDWWPRGGSVFRELWGPWWCHGCASAAFARMAARSHQGKLRMGGAPWHGSAPSHAEPLAPLLPGATRGPAQPLAPAGCMKPELCPAAGFVAWHRGNLQDQLLAAAAVCPSASVAARGLGPTGRQCLRTWQLWVGMPRTAHASGTGRWLLSGASLGRCGPGGFGES